MTENAPEVSFELRCIATDKCILLAYLQSLEHNQDGRGQRQRGGGRAQRGHRGQGELALAAAAALMCQLMPLKDKKRFEVKKWNAVALWAWDIVVDNCAICR